MTVTERREFIVVGGGLLGLAAARALGARGHDAVCLEQASVGHEWSGSKGGSRIFRLGYDDPLYVAMAVRALEEWRNIEAECGAPLLEPCGLLLFGSGLDDLVSGMGSAGAEAEVLDPAAVAERYPRVALEGEAVLDPTASVLLADRVLEALRTTSAAELREHCAVTAITEGPRSVQVRTDDGELEASVVVVCAGPGTASLLGTAGVTCRIVPSLEQVAYFAPTGVEGPAPLAGLPAIIQRSATGGPVSGGGGECLASYGLPATGYGWYKLGLHHAGREVVPGVGPLEPDPELTGRLVDAARSLLSDFEPEPRLVERCVYDNTVDEHFVLDRVGRIVIGAGTSGHGFKFGSLLGIVLADLATGAVPGVALDRFSTRRVGVA